MAPITAQDVKKLREQTGQGMMDCKKALQEAEGDLEKAVELLRKKGGATLANRADRQTAEGRIGYYIHHNNKVGAMVEVNCETDFVANSDDFRQFATDLAMHVCAANPLAVTPDQLDGAVVEKERQFIKEQVLAEGKPEKIADKIVDGKMTKFFQESVLIEQPYVKDDKLTVKDLLEALAAKIGEKVAIRRFARFAVGG